MKIERTLNPSNQDIDFLINKINAETPNVPPAYCFAFFIRNDKNEIIAGCNGSVIFGEIYTDQLWVDPNYRKQGLGKKLMDEIHEYGRLQGCEIATVATMNFQNARKFYENLGYDKEFERQGYINNSSCILLKKILK